MQPSKIDPEFIDRMLALQPALRHQAAFLIGRKTQIGAPEDFVQDAIITALNCAGRYSDDNLSGWLMKILDGHIRNARRRVHNCTSVPLSPEEGADGDSYMHDVPMAPTQQHTLEVDDVLAALKTLPAADQEIIRLARLEELSYEEIAARLKLPLGTLHSRLSRATARLRAVYDTEPDTARVVAQSMCNGSA